VYGSQNRHGFYRNERFGGPSFAASLAAPGDASALIDGVTIQDIGPVAAVPEASTTLSFGLLLTLGLGGLALEARRRTILHRF